MKRTTLNLVIILLTTLFSAPVFSQQAYRIKSHNLVVKGTSNLHDWTANAEKADGNFKLIVNEGKIAEVDAFSLKVDAKSLKGSKGNIMDKKIEDALVLIKIHIYPLVSGGTVPKNQVHTKLQLMGYSQ